MPKPNVNLSDVLWSNFVQSHGWTCLAVTVVFLFGCGALFRYVAPNWVRINTPRNVFDVMKPWRIIAILGTLVLVALLFIVGYLSYKSLFQAEGVVVYWHTIIAPGVSSGVLYLLFYWILSWIWSSVKLKFTIPFKSPRTIV